MLLISQDASKGSTILERLLEVLNTPSEAVQRAVSDCLPSLMASQKALYSFFFKNLQFLLSFCFLKESYRILQNLQNLFSVNQYLGYNSFISACTRPLQLLRIHVCTDATSLCLDLVILLLSLVTLVCIVLTS